MLQTQEHRVLRTGSIRQQGFDTFLPWSRGKESDADLSGITPSFRQPVQELAATAGMLYRYHAWRNLILGPSNDHVPSNLLGKLSFNLPRRRLTSSASALVGRRRGWRRTATKGVTKKKKRRSLQSSQRRKTTYQANSSSITEKSAGAYSYSYRATSYYSRQTFSSPPYKGAAERGVLSFDERRRWPMKRVERCVEIITIDRS